MLKNNSRNTKKRCNMFKVNNNDSTAMTPFWSGVGRSP